MKLGVVVVTHGQLATELVNSAEMIVGDLPQFAAVSIGWHDDVDRAREEIGLAIARVGCVGGRHRGGAGGRAGPHRHVRRHAGQPGRHVRERARRGDHRRQPADADQARAAAEDRPTCRRSRARCASTDATPSGWRRTCCAGRRRDAPATVTILNPLGLHAARPRRGSSTRPAGSRCRIRVGRGGPRGRRQEHHGPPAAGGGAGQRDHHHGGRPGRGRPRRGAVRADRARLRRGAMRLIGLGVSAGIGIGKALVLKRGTRDLQLPRPRRPGRPRARAAGATRASDRASSCSRSASRIAESAGAEHAYLFDAQLLMLDDAMLIERAAEIIRAERLNAGSALERALDEISTLFDQAEDAYLRERKGDVGDVVGRLCMNLRAGGDPLELFKRSRGPARARRRRADAVGDRAARLATARRASSPTPGAGPITRRSWRARSTCPPSRGCTTPARSSRRARSLAVDGATGEVFVDPDAADLEHVARPAAAARGATSSRSTSTAGCRRSPKTACRSGWRPTSSRPTTPCGRGSGERTASACSDRSSCWPAGGTRR